MITKTCEICGCAFQVRPYRTNKARFCSQSCGGKWHMSSRTMPNSHKTGNKWRTGKRPTNAFESGHKTWNKDVKGIHLSPETEFQKGCISKTRVPVGTVTIRHDKNRRLRAFIKVSDPNIWRLRAVVIWEKAHGPVPNGKVIHHKDRNALNDALENLEDLTRTEHIKEHRLELIHSKAS